VYRILVNVSKRRGVREGRSVPWSSLPGAEDEGPTVDPARFQRAGEPYPGHWREFPAPWPSPPASPSPEREALASELRARMGAALAQLPARQRVVITLRDVDGYTSDEVCAILEISAANERVLLHRARAFVRVRLEEYVTMIGAVKER
jgi:RNA polymerase sigma-70 factor (ECF subfamily)